MPVTDTESTLVRALAGLSQALGRLCDQLLTLDILDPDGLAVLGVAAALARDCDRIGMRAFTAQAHAIAAQAVARGEDVPPPIARFLAAAEAHPPHPGSNGYHEAGG